MTQLDTFDSVKHFATHNKANSSLAAQWLGRWTYDREVVGSTSGRVAIKWLLLQEWVIVCGQVNHLGI